MLMKMLLTAVLVLVSVLGHADESFFCPIDPGPLDLRRPRLRKPANERLVSCAGDAAVITGGSRTSVSRHVVRFPACHGSQASLPAVRLVSRGWRTARMSAAQRQRRFVRTHDEGNVMRMLMLLVALLIPASTFAR